MGKQPAKYATRTEPAIKQALVTLLARKAVSEITVSELARTAHISRSTFYEHFDNVAQVYDALVGDLLRDMSPFINQVMCSDGFQEKGRSFCSIVRDAGEYGAAVRDGRFIDSLLAQGGACGEHDLYGLLISAGYDEAEARGVCSFQMAGCFSASRTASIDDAEWRNVRSVIDRFILGGVAALLAAKKGRR